jgi:hypothetical protein
MVDIMTNISECRVTIARTREDVEDALLYITNVMRRRFGCEPPPTAGVIFVAKIEREIVGTAVIESTTVDTPFSLESRYDFDRAATPYPFDRSVTVQGSRWIATREDVSHRVFHELASIAYAFGKRYLLVEAKPYSVKRMEEFGITCPAIKRCVLSLEKTRATVGPEGMRYFEDPPSPCLYMMELSHIISALGPHL